MKDVKCMKRFIKNRLYEIKTLPEYQPVRDRIGIENLTLPFAKNDFAHMCNFDSWEDLLQAPPERKRFIRLVLSHPYVCDDGYFDKSMVPNWTTGQWNDWVSGFIHNITDPYKYERICNMSKKLKELLKPIKSINYKTGYDKIYYVVGREILRDDLPCGNVFFGDFIFAMLLAGFKMVQSPAKQMFYFNVGQKQLKRIQQRQLLLGLVDGAVIDHMYDYWAEYKRIHGVPVIT